MVKEKIKSTNVLGIFLACLIFILGFAHPAKADTTYTYTGNPFTGFHGNSACPPQCRITGTFEVAGPPPVNLTLNEQQFQFDVTPLTYSFTDGHTTWTNTNSCPDFFAISTDASGNITNWVIRLFTPTLNAPCAGGGIYTGFQLVTSNNAPGTIDIVIEAPTAVNFAAISQDPGTWSVQTGPPDTTPPTVIVSPKPSTLWPPNGQMISVAVSGTITDSGSGVDPKKVSFSVEDEYGSIQPSGAVKLEAGGRYSFTISLEASRKGDDEDGRQYTIVVSARDLAGNLGSASTTVNVPHDQRH